MRHRRRPALLFHPTGQGGRNRQAMRRCRYPILRSAAAAKSGALVHGMNSICGVTLMRRADFGQAAPECLCTAQGQGSLSAKQAICPHRTLAANSHTACHRIPIVFRGSNAQSPRPERTRPVVGQGGLHLRCDWRRRAKWANAVRWAVAATGRSPMCE